MNVLQTRMNRTIASLFVVVLLIFHVLSVVECRQWAIEFKSNAGGALDSSAFVAEFAKKHNLEYKGTVGVLTDVHLFETPLKDTAGERKKRDLEDVSFVQYLENNQDDESHPIKWFEEQIPRKREKRVVIDDPLYPEQWHLHRVKPSTSRNHLNIEKAWAQGYFGEGVRIAIVDDGIQSTHPDLRENIAFDSSFNFNRDIPSPDPTYLNGASGDWHGTASAGAAAARNDGKTCGVGVAPHASLAAIAILQNNADVSDSVEAKALVYKYDQNDIYSNSWGPIQPGAGHMNEAPGPLLERSIDEAIQKGRRGLGSIYVWAAGNDGRSDDNCNYDGYANMRYAVMIGSTDDTGDRPTYSEPCAALAAVAPGGTITNRARIHTSDLLDNSGLTEGNCTTFAGTSASCPMAAGIIALILQVNPNLSWLEVQYVLAMGSLKHNDDSDWVQNAAGLWVSHNYGWGLLDAEKLIEAAKGWGSRKVEEHKLEYNNATRLVINDRGGEAAGVIVVEEVMKVHHVEVKLWTNHRNVADTNVVLISPSGTAATLASRHRDTLSKWQGWKFLSRMHWGEEVHGAWTLRITDNNQKGALERWTLTLYGDKATMSTTLSTPTVPQVPTELPQPQPQPQPEATHHDGAGSPQPLLSSNDPLLLGNDEQLLELQLKQQELLEMQEHEKQQKQLQQEALNEISFSFLVVCTVAIAVFLGLFFFGVYRFIYLRYTQVK